MGVRLTPPKKPNAVPWRSSKEHHCRIELITFNELYSHATRADSGLAPKHQALRLDRALRARIILGARRFRTTCEYPVSRPKLGSQRNKHVARTAAFAVRVFSLATIATVPYSIAVSKLRRPFLSDRYFFISVRLLKRREKLTEPDFALLARAFNRARALHPFYLTAWVFLPDPSADGHCICAPVHPATISLAMKSLRSAPTNLIAPSRSRKDADRKIGGPRYPLY